MENTSRWAALNVLCVGVLMIVLDITVANVSLPSIQRDLGFTQSGLAWVLNSYMIAFAGLLLLAGRLGDLIGKRNVFVGGLVIFTVASALCGLAQSQEFLVAARFLQGVGGAMSQAVALGIIITLFPSPQDRARALGRFAFVASAGGSVGLVLGGFITETINWHWIFFVNVPIGVLTVVLSMKLLSADAGIGIEKGVDVVGALLITGALMLGVYTIVGPAAKSGWGSTRVLLLLAGALVCLVFFVIREATAKTPLMPLRIFNSRVVAVTNLVQALSVAGMFSMFFMGTLYVQNVLKFDARETGLAFLPATFLMGLLSWKYSERVVLKFGALRCLLAGLVFLGFSLVLYAQAPVDGRYVAHVLPVMLLMGVGGGISFPALMNLAMSGATPQDAGMVSGLIGTTAQVGGAIGLAVLATLSTNRTTELLKDGASPASALTSGYHLAFYVGASLMLVSFVFAVAFLKRGEPGADPVTTP